MHKQNEEFTKEIEIIKGKRNSGAEEYDEYNKSCNRGHQ